MEKTQGSILIIDDEKPILLVLSRILQKQGYTVDTAETGHAAIEKIKKHSFDVALIDLKLPDVSGIDLLQMFNAEKPYMKKIVLTGDIISEGEVLEEEADAVLKKPCKAEDLLRVIKETLQENHKV